MTFLNIIAFVGIPSAVTGFCFWLLEQKIKRNEKKRDGAEAKREERERNREKNEILLVKSVGAAIALGEAAALALKNGKCNGETEAALAYAREVKHEQKDFLTEQGIKNLY